MLLNLYIGGIDYIDKVLEVPFIDESTPEFGNLEGLLNDIIDLKLQIKYLDHFNIQQDMEVEYLRNHIVMFKGKVSKVNFNEKYITVQCKSNTTLLFNRHIRENEIMSPYVADDMYPADIIKEMLELIGLRMNYTSYINALQYHQQLEVTLSCTNENWVTSEILNKIAEVTCARIYLFNDEFHYEPFGMYETPPHININSRYWVDYPTVDRFEKFEKEYGGTEVKIGESVSYKVSNERLPEKTIDLSISTNNGVYTDSATTAMHIVDLYDIYLSQKKYRLKGSLKLSIGQYIHKGSFIRWDNRIYAIINIKNSSYLKKEIEAVGIDYYNVNIKNLYIQGGTLTVALDHNSLTGLQGGTTGQYYHLTQTKFNLVDTNITTLTDGSNADSLHVHDLSSVTGDLDDITQGTTSKKLTSTEYTDLTDSGATTLHKHALSGQDGDLDDIDDGTTYKRIAGSQDLEINNIDASGKISLNFGHHMYGIGGKGRTIPTDVSFNSVQNGGLYQSTYMSSGGLAVDRPQDAGAFFLLVMQHGTNYIFQQATRLHPAECKSWVRQRNSGTWSDWYPIYQGKGEYTFRAKWTGDLAAGTGTATILENTDNKLSSVTAANDFISRLNFESGFLSTDDIVEVKVGRLTSTNKNYNIVSDSSGFINVFRTGYYPNTNENYVTVYTRDSTDNLIDWCNDIGTDENFVDVIIRKRG